ncbi:hypothetical protein DIPPA_15435 [Diplonema papillatum]|nr:hypothetical protein DIPPA_15435 [Diplonema papillatum]
MACLDLFFIGADRREDQRLFYEECARVEKEEAYGRMAAAQAERATRGELDGFGSAVLLKVDRGLLRKREHERGNRLLRGICADEGIEREFCAAKEALRRAHVVVFIAETAGRHRVATEEAEGRSRLLSSAGILRQAFDALWDEIIELATVQAQCRTAIALDQLAACASLSTWEARARSAAGHLALANKLAFDTVRKSPGSPHLSAASHRPCAASPGLTPSPPVALPFTLKPIAGSCSPVVHLWQAGEHHLRTRVPTAPRHCDKPHPPAHPPRPHTARPQRSAHPQQAGSCTSHHSNGGPRPPLNSCVSASLRTPSDDPRRQQAFAATTPLPAAVEGCVMAPRERGRPASAGAAAWAEVHADWGAAAGLAVGEGRERDRIERGRAAECSDVLLAFHCGELQAMSNELARRSAMVSRSRGLNAKEYTAGLRSSLDRLLGAGGARKPGPPDTSELSPCYVAGGAQHQKGGAGPLTVASAAAALGRGDAESGNQTVQQPGASPAAVSGQGQGDAERGNPTDQQRRVSAASMPSQGDDAESGNQTVQQPGASPAAVSGQGQGDAEHGNPTDQQRRVSAASMPGERGQSGAERQARPCPGIEDETPDENAAGLGNGVGFAGLQAAEPANSVGGPGREANDTGSGGGLDSMTEAAVIKFQALARSYFAKSRLAVRKANVATYSSRLLELEQAYASLRGRTDATAAPASPVLDSPVRSPRSGARARRRGEQFKGANGAALVIQLKIRSVLARKRVRGMVAGAAEYAGRRLRVENRAAKRGLTGVVDVAEQVDEAVCVLQRAGRCLAGRRELHTRQKVAAIYIRDCVLLDQMACDDSAAMSFHSLSEDSGFGRPREANSLPLGYGCEALRIAMTARPSQRDSGGWNATFAACTAPM